MTNRKIMAVGAHADDHELNVGGSLAKYFHRGYEIVYVMSTNNMSGSWTRLEADGRQVSEVCSWRKIMPQRILEADAGAKALGTRPIYLDHPQRHYVDEEGKKIEVRYGSERPECVPPNVPTILTACSDNASIERVVELIKVHDPEVILTHGMPMVNPEHFCTCILVNEAYRRAVRDGYDGMLLLWQDLGVWDFGEAYSGWDSFIDISDFWDEKIGLSGLHACQKPNPAALDWPTWGAACGCKHAEVFTIAGRSRLVPFGEFTTEILENISSHRKGTGDLKNEMD